MDELTLTFDGPAQMWNEALPLGNGAMGAMSYGRFQGEKIELNLDTLWSGTGREKENKKEADWEYLRKLIFEERHQEAENYCKETVLGDWTEGYLPAGNLCIDMKVPSFTKKGTYQRTLSLEKAVEQVIYHVNGSSYQREFFVSMAEPVMAFHYHGEKAGNLEMTLSLESQIENLVFTLQGNSILMEGQAPVYAAPSYYSCENPIVYQEGQGTRFAIGVYIQAEEGCIQQKGNSLSINTDKDVYLYLSGITDFEQKDKYWEMRDRLLAKLEKLSYEELKKAHIKAYGEYFNRMSLTLNPSPENELALKMFHYARYLMIASSKPGTKCANLQGIWNHDLRAPWSSNYTVNINTEMNYWMAEKANLSDCHQPLFDLIEKTAGRGEKTAEKLYHLKGWVSHHNLDIWGHSSPVGQFGQDENPCTYSMWPMSSGWLCCHLWEHYCYTLDEGFLREKAFPIIKGAVEFYLGYLIPYEGYLVTAPSTSPENTFIGKDQKAHSVTMASTMDMSILRELFGLYLKACQILGTTEFTEEVKNALQKLPSWKIGKEGQLQEWFYDYPEAEVHHRHVSHLFGLYPGNQIHKEDEELIHACQVSLERRGDEGTGWCMAWKACLWARLGDGNHALRLLKNQLRVTREEKCSLVGGGIYPNMLCAHPPFQIDGNFGFAAAMLEMLVQYEENKIRLLPALPDEWIEGEINGVKAPGNITLGFAWKKGHITRVSLNATKDTERVLLYNGMEKKALLKAGTSYDLEGVR